MSGSRWKQPMMMVWVSITCTSDCRRPCPAAGAGQSSTPAAPPRLARGGAIQCRSQKLLQVDQGLQVTALASGWSVPGCRASVRARPSTALSWSRRSFRNQRMMRPLLIFLCTGGGGGGRWSRWDSAAAGVCRCWVMVGRDGDWSIECLSRQAASSRAGRAPG